MPVIRRSGTQFLEIGFASVGRETLITTARRDGVQHVRHRSVVAVPRDQRPALIPAPTATPVAADGDGVGGVRGG